LPLKKSDDFSNVGMLQKISCFFGNNLNAFQIIGCWNPLSLSTAGVAGVAINVSANFNQVKES